MKKNTRVWFKSGMLQNLLGVVISYAGEGYYWVEDIETHKRHYCFMLEMYAQEAICSTKEAITCGIEETPIINSIVVNTLMDLRAINRGINPYQ